MYALTMLRKISKPLIVTTFMLMVYIGVASFSFAGVEIKHEPTSIVVNQDESEIKIIIDLFLPTGGTATIEDPSTVDIFGYNFSDVGTSSGDGFRLTMTIDDPDLIIDILSGADPINISFPIGTLSNGSGTTNDSAEIVQFVTPANGTFFNLSDLDEFKATTTLTTSSAGTHVLTFFDKADFELNYPDDESYYEIIPKDISQGKLYSWGNDIDAFTETFTVSGSSLYEDVSGQATNDKPYSAVYYTTSPVGGAGANDFGAYLYMSTVAEGTPTTSDDTGRPALTGPKRLSSYRFNEFNGAYNAYMIVNFENDIESNIFDEDGTSQLAYGIDFRQDSADPYVNIKHAHNFDAMISGNQLIIMMDDTVFGSNGLLFFELPKGTIRDTATGKTNSNPITIIDYFNLDFANDPREFTHGQIQSGSMDVTVGSNEADVELQLADSGSVYNSFVPVDEFDLALLIDFNTLAASATEDVDAEINVKNSTEYIGGLTSADTMKTTLADLSPETDYYWITTAGMISAIDGDDMIEGRVTKFTTDAFSAGMEMTDLEYFIGGGMEVNNDDYAVISFDQEYSEDGADSDYSIWIDYDSNGTLDLLLDAEDGVDGDGQAIVDDYDIEEDLQNLGPNQVKFKFKGDMETHLENIYGARLKVEVRNISNLEPDVASNKRYLYVDIPDRYAMVEGLTLQIPSVVDIPVLAFDSMTFDYLNFPILPSYYNDLVSTGTVMSNVKDNSIDVIDENNGDGSFTVDVTAAEGNISNTYTIACVSDKFLLKDITLDDVSIDVYQPHVFTYDILLTQGTTSPPDIGAYLDDSDPVGVDIDFEESGDLNSVHTILVKTVDTEDNNTVIHTYTLNFTVEADDTPDDNDDDNTDTDDSSSGSSSSSSSDKKKKSDESITSQISNSNTSLLDLASNSPSSTEDQTPSDNVQEITNVLEKIKTPSGARIVLEQMPKTLEELKDMKASLNSLDEQLKMDKDIAALMAETERLISLLSQPAQSKTLIFGFVEPLGTYYNGTNPQSQSSKDMMNSAIDMSNSAITQAGTVHTSWKSVKIENGRVNVDPTNQEILQAARKAAQTEKQLEDELNAHMEEGLQNAIVSTVTLKIPADLENAVRTSAGLDQGVLDILSDNDIEQFNLDLGPITFGLNDRFIDKHKHSDLSFNVDREPALDEEDNESLPSGTSSVGAPVLNLSATQNKEADDKFEYPFKITIKLDVLGYTPKDPENFFIGRKNEVTGEWEREGGIYDPATNSITIYRKHLSKYTLLKSEKNFSNIEDSWAKNEIASLKGKGIISNDTLFDPDSSISREEFACWVSKAYGLDATTEDGAVSLDPNSEYYHELQQLYDNAVIASGASPTTLDTSEELTRQELAVIISNAFENYEYGVDTDTFELAQYEEDLPTWAVGSVETVVENGLVDESFFGSADTVTKEEAANILYQVYR